MLLKPQLEGGAAATNLIERVAEGVFVRQAKFALLLQLLPESVEVALVHGFLNAPTSFDV